jgi:hypothetical protein
VHFNDLLRLNRLSPDDVTIVLNTTNLQPFRDMLPFLAGSRRDLFEAYQSVHSDQAAKTIRNRSFMASFVPLPDRRMLFEGLYAVRSATPRPMAEIYKNPAFDELEFSFGAIGTGSKANMKRARDQVLFDFKPMDQLAEYRGRIVIRSPTGRAYARLASNLDLEVLELSQSPQFTPPVPRWQDVIISAEFLRNLPANWAAALRQWRGVYLIVDQVDGQRYVGSACGQDNLCGRWQEHVAKDSGITVELRQRDPQHFRFSILELLAPSASTDEAIAIENSWKERLDTRKFGLNVN